MSTALREVLAQLDVKVIGIDQIDAAMSRVDAFKSQVSGQAQQSMPSLDVNRSIGFGSRNMTQGLGEAAAQATPRTRGFANAMSGLGTAVAGFATTAATTALQVSSELAHEFVGLTREIIHLGDELDAQSKRTGLSTDELQRWQYIAEQSNVPAESLTMSIGRLQRAAVEHAGSFRQLGVDVRGANGQIKPSGQLFREVGLALAGIQNPSERAARAQQIFGRSGAALLPIFADGAAGLDQLSARFDELGGGLDKNAVQSAAAADDAMHDLELGLRSLKTQLAVSVLPTLTQLIEGTATAAGQIAHIVQTSSIAQTAIGVLAVAFGYLALTELPTIAVAAALGLLFLAVEDVVTAFRGGDSVFARWEEGFARAHGETATFQGQLDEVAIGWDVMKARALGALIGVAEGVKNFRNFFGDHSQDAALDELMRQSGDASREALADAHLRASLFAGMESKRRQEAQFFASQATEPARPTVPAGGAGTRPARHRTTPRTQVHVQQQNSIVIQGGDPAATRRAVEQAHQDHLRRVSDALPVADESDDEEGDGG